MLRSNSFASLGEDFFVPLNPTPLPAPYWVCHSEPVATQLGLTAPEGDDAWLQVLAGNHVVPGTHPLASVYSGHQFGVWAGQLGDGRAILLGDMNGWEIQLKGAGLTPFSRMGDGRAVLRSSVREFLASQAMHGLGIPTTLALSVIGSDLPVRRETMETAAVVTRVAPTFIRFGHFEHFCHHDQHTQLKQLADYVIERFYPACSSDYGYQGNAYAALLHAVIQRTAEMVGLWQAAGFCHGVMNTDNMSILGLTIDYGPFQFLDGYDPEHICNHSDTHGRYAFSKQPKVAFWNLHCLAQALLPLVEDQSLAIAALETYQVSFEHAFATRMAAKLGFAQADQETRRLADEVLRLLAQERVDYTIFWRRLSHWSQNHDQTDNGVRDLFIERSGIDSWLLQFSELLTQHLRGHSTELMLRTNPKFILRNHLGEMAIEAAKGKDFTLVSQLLRVLERPFEEHPDAQAFADFPPAWAQEISISCSS